MLVTMYEIQLQFVVDYDVEQQYRDHDVHQSPIDVPNAISQIMNANDNVRLLQFDDDHLFINIIRRVLALIIEASSHVEGSPHRERRSMRYAIVIPHVSMPIAVWLRWRLDFDW
jgi:hypothetical protein